MAEIPSVGSIDFSKLQNAQDVGEIEGLLKPFVDSSDNDSLSNLLGKIEVSLGETKYKFVEVINKKVSLKAENGSKLSLGLDKFASMLFEALKKESGEGDVAEIPAAASEEEKIPELIPEPEVSDLGLDKKEFANLSLEAAQAMFDDPNDIFTKFFLARNIAKNGNGKLTLQRSAKRDGKPGIILNGPDGGREILSFRAFIRLVEFNKEDRAKLLEEREVEEKTKVVDSDKEEESEKPERQKSQLDFLRQRIRIQIKKFGRTKLGLLLSSKEKGEKGKVEADLTETEVDKVAQEADKLLAEMQQVEPVVEAPEVISKKTDPKTTKEKSGYKEVTKPFFSLRRKYKKALESGDQKQIDEIGKEIYAFVDGIDSESSKFFAQLSLASLEAKMVGKYKRSDKKERKKWDKAGPEGKLSQAWEIGDADFIKDQVLAMGIQGLRGFDFNKDVGVLSVSYDDRSGESLGRGFSSSDEFLYFLEARKIMEDGKISKEEFAGLTSDEVEQMFANPVGEIVVESKGKQILKLIKIEAGDSGKGFKFILEGRKSVNVKTPEELLELINFDKNYERPTGESDLVPPPEVIEIPPEVIAEMNEEEVKELRGWRALRKAFKKALYHGDLEEAKKLHGQLKEQIEKPGHGKWAIRWFLKSDANVLRNPTSLLSNVSFDERKKIKNWLEEVKKAEGEAKAEAKKEKQKKKKSPASGAETIVSVSNKPEDGEKKSLKDKVEGFFERGWEAKKQGFDSKKKAIEKDLGIENIDEKTLEEYFANYTKRFEGFDLKNDKEEINKQLAALMLTNMIGVTGRTVRLFHEKTFKKQSEGHRLRDIIDIKKHSYDRSLKDNTKESNSNRFEYITHKTLQFIMRAAPVRGGINRHGVPSWRPMAMDQKAAKKLAKDDNEIQEIRRNLKDMSARVEDKTLAEFVGWMAGFALGPFAKVTLEATKKALVVGSLTVDLAGQISTSWLRRNELIDVENKPLDDAEKKAGSKLAFLISNTAGGAAVRRMSREVREFTRGVGGGLIAESLFESLLEAFDGDGDVKDAIGDADTSVPDDTDAGDKVGTSDVDTDASKPDLDNATEAPVPPTETPTPTPDDVAPGPGTSPPPSPTETPTPTPEAPTSTPDATDTIGEAGLGDFPEASGPNVGTTPAPDIDTPPVDLPDTDTPPADLPVGPDAGIPKGPGIDTSPDSPPFDITETTGETLKDNPGQAWWNFFRDQADATGNVRPNAGANLLTGFTRSLNEITDNSDFLSNELITIDNPETLSSLMDAMNAAIDKFDATGVDSLSPVERILASGYIGDSDRMIELLVEQGLTMEQVLEQVTATP